MQQAAKYERRAAEIAKAEPCPYCNGTGADAAVTDEPRENCSHCGGTGRADGENKIAIGMKRSEWIALSPEARAALQSVGERAVQAERAHRITERDTPVPLSTSLVRLGEGNGVSADVDQRISVPTSGTQEETPGFVNLGGCGAKHDFKAAASALPHDGSPADDGNGTANHKDDCRYWKSGDFCTCGATQ
jgi:hypothetical protein